MNHFDNILKKIRNVKIQGAQNIALAGVQAFLLQQDKISIEQILKTRPTEPMMQNAVHFLEKAENPEKAAAKLKTYIKQSDDKIAKTGAKLVKNNMNIFSHCHSTTVMRILKQAKKQNKHFVVYTTEVEPLLQGRQTAEELAKAGINVIVFPDLAGNQAIKKCDLFLLGADAYSKKGFANKIGSSTFCEIAKDHKIPTYSCGISLKLTNKIVLEKRPSKEVWDERNEKIEVINPAFDFVDKSLITGVISEFGINQYSEFIKKARRNMKNWI